MNRLSREVVELLECLLAPLTCTSLLLAAFYKLDEYTSKWGWTGISGAASIVCAVFAWRICTSKYRSDIDGDTRPRYGKTAKSATVLAFLVSIMITAVSLYASRPTRLPALNVSILNDDIRQRTLNPNATVYLYKAGDDEHFKSSAMAIESSDTMPLTLMPGETRVAARFTDQAAIVAHIDDPDVKFRIELKMADGPARSALFDFSRDTVTNGIVIPLLDRVRRLSLAEQHLGLQLPKAIQEAREADDIWRWHALVKIGELQVKNGDDSGRSVIREVVQAHYQGNQPPLDHVAKAHLALGDMMAATETLNEITPGPQNLYVFRMVSLRKIETADIDGALDVLSKSDVGLSPLNQEWYAEQLALRGYIDRALEIVETLEKKSSEAPLCAIIDWYASRNSESAMRYLESLGHGFFRDAAIVSLVEAYADAAEYSEARDLIGRIGETRYIHYPLGIAALAAGYGRNGELRKSAKEFSRAIDAARSLRSAGSDNASDTALEQILSLQLTLDLPDEAEEVSRLLTRPDYRARGFARVSMAHFNNGNVIRSLRCLGDAVDEVRKQSLTEYAVVGVPDVIAAIVQIGSKEAYGHFETVEEAATSRVDVIDGIVRGIAILRKKGGVALRQDAETKERVAPVREGKATPRIQQRSR